MKIDDSKYICDSLIGNTISISFNSELSFVQDFAHAFAEAEDIVFSESPDLYLKFKDIVYCIEHFRVDASESDRGGSTYLQEYNERVREKQFDILTDKAVSSTKGFALETESIMTSLTFDNLLNNTVRSLDKHYVKIPQYINNLHTYFGTKVEYRTIFFIQCDILFPSFILNEVYSMRAVNVLNDIRFIDFLKGKTELDGIILHYDKSSNSEVVNRFCRTTLENLENYVVDNHFVYDFTKTRIHDFENPMSASTVIHIPKDKK
ncbi:hypothetical protein KQ51_01088 [Candidatus Izimaplasma bacterium HR1]|jgi:hypothetical protein|uniref:hypothetical protein n=1 Tax=Candidatus Izimoplasma sp. HR1 TaxID=1541959 RepID=UPI0004F8CB5D|nr:hypothetical protein KQ51_01088 [Candidatus Izimaplasma bacterium HR1]